jgi:hypothetical protein
VQFGTLNPLAPLINLTAKAGNATTAGSWFAFDSRDRMPADVNGQAFVSFEQTQKERRKQENISDTYLSKGRTSKQEFEKRSAPAIAPDRTEVKTGATMLMPGAIERPNQLVFAFQA